MGKWTCKCGQAMNDHRSPDSNAYSVYSDELLVEIMNKKDGNDSISYEDISEASFYMWKCPKCGSFMVFGGYSLYLQKSGKVDLVSILNKGTQSDAILAILKTLPMSRIMMLFLCVVCFVYLATTIDSCAYVLAGVTTDDLEPTKDPARWNRLFWAILFSILSVAIMVVRGIETVKIMSVVTGIFLVPVLFLLMVAVKIRLEENLFEKGKRRK